MHVHTHNHITFVLPSIKTAAHGARVNGIICHANQGHKRVCPLVVRTSLAEVTSANSTVSL